MMTKCKLCGCNLRDGIYILDIEYEFEHRGKSSREMLKSVPLKVCLECKELISKGFVDYSKKKQPVERVVWDLFHLRKKVFQLIKHRFRMATIKEFKNNE